MDQHRPLVVVGRGPALGAGHGLGHRGLRARPARLLPGLDDVLGQRPPLVGPGGQVDVGRGPPHPGRGGDQKGQAVDQGHLLVGQRRPQPLDQQGTAGDVGPEQLGAALTTGEREDEGLLAGGVDVAGDAELEHRRTTVGRPRLGHVGLGATGVRRPDDDAPVVGQRGEEVAEPGQPGVGPGGDGLVPDDQGDVDGHGPARQVRAARRRSAAAPAAASASGETSPMAKKPWIRPGPGTCSTGTPASASRAA